MAKKNTKRSKKSADVHNEESLALPLIAILVASAPLYFFRDPFQLHDTGLLKGFYGIAIWSPSILAGYAFYRSVSFTKKTRAPLIEDATKRTVATIAVLVGFFGLMAQVFQGDHVGMESMRPWSQLALFIPMFGMLNLLETFFYQGMWQDGPLRDKPLVTRLLGVGAASLVVHLGYILAIGDTGFLFYPEQLISYVGVLAVGTILIGLLYELGWALFVCAIINFVFGAALIWFRQGVFL